MRDAPTNKSKQLVHGEYFPYIDGIRALAVLAVVFYHLWAPLCPGGFVGVDVFFVISGFLITGGILRGLSNGAFTIHDFYHRRIKRILPAYFTMILGVFTIGCAIYYCTPLTHLSDAAVMGTLFMANLYFRKMGGDYFAPDIHGNPLLHLWSLSVEEQFYLFIPLLFILVYRIKKSWMFPIVALLAICSFSGAVHSVIYNGAGDAFYLPHLRAWELLAGSLLAMAPARGRKKSMHSWLAGAGLILVLVSYFMLTSETPFPGLAAVSPVIGTILLIRYGSLGWIGRLLSCWPSVGVGKISYSLYLWHWPVFVFWKYATYDKLYGLDYVGMLSLSLALAYLSWRFVELPVRISGNWAPNKSFAFCTCGISVLVGIGIATVYTRGLANHIHKSANQLIKIRQPFFVEGFIGHNLSRLGSQFGLDTEPFNQLEFSLGGQGDFPLGAEGAPEMFLVGDSHAGMLQIGMDHVLKEKGLAGFVMSRGGKSLYQSKSVENHLVLSFLEKNPTIQKVVLAQYWPVDGSKKDVELTMEYIREFSKEVGSSGRQLYICADIPQRDYSPTDMAAKQMILPWNRVDDVFWVSRLPLDQYHKKSGEFNKRLRSICSKTGAIYVPLYEALRKDDCYIAFDGHADSAVPLYVDTNHLSPEGSLLVAKFMCSYIFREPDPMTVGLH